MYILFMLRRKKNLDIEFKYVHNIIQIHNSIMRDLQYFVEYSPYSIWMWNIPQNIISYAKYCFRFD